MQLCDRARQCGILAYSTLSSDEQRKQMRRFHGKVFLSKGVSCNATQERGEGLYLAYCPLTSDKARTQMITFHEKDFRQKRYYTTQTKISRTGSTGVRPVREIECTAAECRFSQKNYSQYDASTVPFGASGTLAKKVIPVSVSISATVISCGTAEAACSTQ